MAGEVMSLIIRVLYDCAVFAYFWVSDELLAFVAFYKGNVFCDCK